MTAAEPDERAPAGEVVLRERPRSYVEVLAVATVILIGFGIDLGFDVHGALTHLPGWLIALALIAGIDAIFVASARSTRTLVVTTDEVWVGEEMVVRDEVVGVAPEALSHLPVLGWPNGKPGRTKGVALRLADGRDVLLPSRRPERLAAVLGLAEARALQPPEIRAATADDLPLLAEIDDRAEILFGLSGIDLPEIDFAVPDDAIATWVLDDPRAGLVGFAVVAEVDGEAHLDEIAVLPSVMRTGLGSRLLEHACAAARDDGYRAMTLCTFAEVAWNGPWYASRGFTVVAEPTGGLAARRDRERELGLDSAGRRVAMRRELG